MWCTISIFFRNSCWGSGVSCMQTSYKCLSVLRELYFQSYFEFGVILRSRNFRNWLWLIIGIRKKYFFEMLNLLIVVVVYCALDGITVIMWFISAETWWIDMWLTLFGISTETVKFESLTINTERLNRLDGTFVTALQTSESGVTFRIDFVCLVKLIFSVGVSKWLVSFWLLGVLVGVNDKLSYKTWIFTGECTFMCIWIGTYLFCQLTCIFDRLTDIGRWADWF